MLSGVIELISNSKPNIIEGALCCGEIYVDAITLLSIEYLEKEGVIENSDYEKNIGNNINLELSFARLGTIGYFVDAESFLLKYNYKYPGKTCYISSTKQFSNDIAAPFFLKYQKVITLMNALKFVAKHVYDDSDAENIIIFRDDRSLFVPLIYSAEDILTLSDRDLEMIDDVVSTLTDFNTEKKLLFVNELLDLLLGCSEKIRFQFLLNEISVYNEKCHNAYQYYLRDYSYNKLKIELDSKALEFTQKIQTVINDSQTKLIAIPTAFILVFSNFDFKDPDSIKDFASMCSLFIFAVIIQLFLNNQSSSLNFTQSNINSYKTTFKDRNMVEFIERFFLVDRELKRQRNRLRVVVGLLWIVPLSLLFIWAFIYYNKILK